LSSGLSEQTVVHESFVPRSRPVQTDVLCRLGAQSELLMNADLNCVERSLPKHVQRVLSLKKSGMGKAAIILEVWSARKEATERYKRAELEYTEIVESLTVLESV
jgi:hypothetical protein